MNEENPSEEIKPQTTREGVCTCCHQYKEIDTFTELCAECENSGRCAEIDGFNGLTSTDT